ncbi:MAG: helix-turn-helix transcriptional regulator [Thermodesulfobacteriota bacterium]
MTSQQEMIKIDGSAIRRIREEKGLTQLYLATFIGVTTDTISRWENKRYGTVKRLNAEKLAEALEVEVGELLDLTDKKEEGMADAEAATVEATPPPDDAGEQRPALSLLLPFIALLLALAGAGGWYLLRGSGDRQPAMLGSRSFPGHTAPNSVFPVVLSITGQDNEEVSLIIREDLPESVQPVTAEPGFTSRDKGTLKWIRRTGLPATILLLCRTDDDAISGRRLEFSGSVTQKGMTAIPVTNVRPYLEVAPFHWADSNRDHQIDDEEILSVYDRFSGFEAIGLDFPLIEAVWSAGGYRWDEKGGKFIPQVPAGNQGT